MEEPLYHAGEEPGRSGLLPQNDEECVTGALTLGRLLSP